MPARSLTSFCAGALAATVIVGVPAALAAVDANPTTHDGTAPALTLNPMEFRVGQSLDAALPINPDDFCVQAWNNAIPVRLAWSAGDGTSGLEGFDVYATGAAVQGINRVATYDGGASSHPLTTSNYTGDCGGGSNVDIEYWAVARDVRGNSASSVAVGPAVRAWDENGVDPIGNGNLTVNRSGGWSVANCACFNNGHTLKSSSANASLAFQVTTSRPGQTVALVMPRAANRGRAEVRVDNGPAVTVDTFAASPENRVIVWQQTLSVGSHTVRVRNLGTSGRARIDVDGLLLTQQFVRRAPQFFEVF